MKLIFLSLLIVIQTAIASIQNRNTALNFYTKFDYDIFWKENIDETVELQYYEPTYKLKPRAEYLEYKTEYKTEPKVNWAYWRNDQTFNENQSVEKSDFATVDCELTPNLIYWDEKHLNFGKNFVFDWIDQGYKNGGIFLAHFIFIIKIT